MWNPASADPPRDKGSSNASNSSIGRWTTRTTCCRSTHWAGNGTGRGRSGGKVERSTALKARHRQSYWTIAWRGPSGTDCFVSISPSRRSDVRLQTMVWPAGFRLESPDAKKQCNSYGRMRYAGHRKERSSPGFPGTARTNVGAVEFRQSGPLSVAASRQFAGGQTALRAVCSRARAPCRAPPCSPSDRDLGTVNSPPGRTTLEP